MGAPVPPSPALRAAVAAHRRGDLIAAERLYRQVLQADGGCFEALHNLGHVLVQQDRPADAASAFRRALEVRPGAAVTHNMLAQALSRLALHAEAVEHHRRAIALKPDYAQAHHDLGRLLQALGRMDEARDAVERALALAPARGEYHRSLAEMVRFDEDSPHVQAMEALARDSEALPTIDRIELHYALGKAYADLGRPETSFAQYQAGASLLRRHARYDEASSTTMFDRMVELFTPELVRAKAGLGHPSDRPIFILGMPRSGSTLVEQILAGHPDVAGGGELTAFRDAAAERLGRPEAVRDFDSAALQALGALYLERARPAAADAPFVTDKMPGNFHFLGLIRLALPNARIIQTVRDPLDTCLSCYTTLFLDGHQYSNDLGELGRYYRHYERLMDHWRQVLPEDSMLEVRYEDVVADLEGQARRILEYCGLPWDPACIEFHKAERAVFTASSGQVRRPLYAGSIGRWKAYRPWLEPLFEALGRKVDAAETSSA